MRKIPYHPSYVCFITTVTNDRKRLFLEKNLGERLATMVVMACRAKGFVCLAYAIMPDHVHLLVIAKSWMERTLERVRSNDRDPEKARSNDCGPERVCSDGGWEKARSNDCGPEKVRSGGGLTRVFSKDNRIAGGAPERSTDPGVAKLVQSIKGTFSRTLPGGRIWQRRYFCWYVNHEKHLINVIEYIRYNYWHHQIPDRYGFAPFTMVNEASIKKLFGANIKQE